MIEQQAVSESDDVLQDDVAYCNWPKGPYTQQIKSCSANISNRESNHGSFAVIWKAVEEEQRLR